MLWAGFSGAENKKLLESGSTFEKKYLIGQSRVFIQSSFKHITGHIPG